MSLAVEIHLCISVSDGKEEIDIILHLMNELRVIDMQDSPHKGQHFELDETILRIGDAGDNEGCCPNAHIREDLIFLDVHETRALQAKLYQVPLVIQDFLMVDIVIVVLSVIGVLIHLLK